MGTAVGLLVVLFGVSQGLEKTCDFRQNGTWCFGPLGGTVRLRLTEDHSQILDGDCFKNITRIFLIRKSTFTNLLNRNFTYSDGILSINNVMKDDAAKYHFRIYTEKLTEKENRFLDLYVQAPVSSVQLSYECVSQGGRMVSCTSMEGDDRHYSWTLNGQPLTDAQLLLESNATNNITLRPQVSGTLVCSVGNNVSVASARVAIPWVPKVNDSLCVLPMPPSTTSSKINTSEGATFKIMVGVLITLVILFLGGVAAACFLKKKKGSGPKEEDVQELTYADIRFNQRKARPPQQREEREVVYGHVRPSGPPQPTRAVEDDCMYAEVQCR